MSLSGTPQGHVLPGVLFIFWAGWWTYEVVTSRGAGAYRVGPLERSRFMPMAKLILPIIGILGELVPGAFEWKPSMVNNYQHAIMYVPFMIAGAVDLLARSGRVSRDATYVAYAGALLNAGFLFAGHGHIGGLPDTVHSLLVYVFAAAALLGLLEIRFPSGGIAWLRIGAIYLLGAWFVQIAWILYGSGWDLMDHVARMKAYFFFSMTAVVVSAFLLAVHQFFVAPAPVGRGSGVPSPG